jgi:energy-coupling factor transporter ATP-binding protein EcfA2
MIGQHPAPPSAQGIGAFLEAVQKQSRWSEDRPFYLMVGPAGVGKTTALRAYLKQQEHTEGMVVVEASPKITASVLFEDVLRTLHWPPAHGSIVALLPDPLATDPSPRPAFPVQGFVWSSGSRPAALVAESGAAGPGLPGYPRSAATRYGGSASAGLLPLCVAGPSAGARTVVTVRHCAANWRSPFLRSLPRSRRRRGTRARAGRHTPGRSGSCRSLPVRAGHTTA